jgi:epoxyqueuosine reductase QueG
MAGRFGSVLTDLELPPDTREYTAYDAYCTRCGACVRRCPVKAVSPETGKDHALCAAFLDKTLAAHKPRYGCGKCQTRVPCENAVPPAKTPCLLRNAGARKCNVLWLGRGFKP